MCDAIRSSIHKLQRWSRWSLGMNKQFHSMLNWRCDYLSLLVKGAQFAHNDGDNQVTDESWPIDSIHTKHKCNQITIYMKWYVWGIHIIYPPFKFDCWLAGPATRNQRQKWEICNISFASNGVKDLFLSITEHPKSAKWKYFNKILVI